MSQNLGRFDHLRRPLEKNISMIASTILLLFVIVACGSASPATSPATAPANPSLPVQAAPTSTALPAASATGVPSPQPTVVPATTTPSPLPTASPTSALASLCQGAPASPSPDGKWVLCDLKDAGGNSKAFLAGSTGQKWLVNYPKLSNGIPIYDDSRPLVWTPDGRYVYVAVVGQLGSGGVRTFYAAGDIWRMDLTSGVVQDLLPTGELPYESWFYDLAVSPDGRRLAYVNEFRSPLLLVLLDLPQDTHTEIKLADNPRNAPTQATAGELFWTPDGKSLVYKLVTDHNDNTCSYEYSILIMDLQDRSAQTIIPPTHVPLCNGIPTEYHVVQVSPQQVNLVQNNFQWVYDLATNSLVQTATITPTP